MAHGILQRLVDNVSTEHLHFWLRGISDFTLAESQLSNVSISPETSLMERLVQASKLYLQGLSSLKVSSFKHLAIIKLCESRKREGRRGNYQTLTSRRTTN